MSNGKFVARSKTTDSDSNEASVLPETDEDGAERNVIFKLQRIKARQADAVPKVSDRTSGEVVELTLKNKGNIEHKDV